MSYSLDVNLLLYASDASSPVHAEARSFLEARMSRPDIMYLSWPTLMGYMRIATHPSIFDAPLTPEEAVANIEQLLALPHSRCLAEEDGFWEAWLATVSQVPVRGNLVPDAHLAALLRSHGVTKLYTHDRDFRKFEFLNVEDPLA